MADSVATPSAAYLRMEQKRKLCRDLMGGTTAMRAATTEYLLKFDAEDWVDYNVRLNDSFLVGYFEDAVDAYIGKIFAKPVILSDDTPLPIAEDFWPNVDNQGAGAEPFLYEVMRDAIPSGLSFLLIDSTAPPPKKDAAGNVIPRTGGEEESLKIRPFWKHFRSQDVIECRVIYENGQPKLDRMRVLAKAEKPDGEWGSVCVDRVLVYQRGDRAKLGQERYASFRVYEKATIEGKEVWPELADMAGHFSPPASAKGAIADRFIEIPVVCFYTEKTAPYEAEPPLRDSLADLCLQHYRKKSRLDTMLDAVNTPIMMGNMSRSAFESAMAPAITTNDQKTTNTREIRFGPLSFLFTGGTESTIQWLEHGGTSIAAGREDLRHLEEQIKQAALDPLTKQVTGAQTATAEIRAEERSFTKAQVWAMMAQSAITQCLQWTAAWMGLEYGGAASFGKGVLESLGAGDFAQVVTLFEKGEIDGDALIAEAKRYGVLAPEAARSAKAEERAAQRDEARARLAGMAAQGAAGAGPALTQNTGQEEDEEGAAA